MLLPRQTFVAFDRSLGRRLVRRVRVAALAVAAVTVAACGGSSSPVQMVITPPLVEPASTFTAALDSPVVTDRVRARFDSPDDAHYFRVPVNQPGTLTLRTDGVDTRIEAFDIEGNPLEGIPGSLIVTITPKIAGQGAIISRITPAPGGETGIIYTLTPTVRAGTATTTAATMMMIPSG